MFMSKIGQANKEFVLCVLTETSSTLDVLFHCLKRIFTANCLWFWGGLTF